MIKEVTELPAGFHVLRVPIPNNPLGFLLSYVVEGPDGITLVDAGWNAPESYDALTAQLRGLGLAVSDVRQIILTHMHPDHSGLVDQIRAVSGAKVFAHQNENRLPPYAPTEWDLAIPEIIPPPFDSYGIPRDIYTQSAHAQARTQRPGWTKPDVRLKGGEVIPAGDVNLEVIWTPGHAHGHICLYAPAHKILFTGDHVLPVTTPNVSLLWAKDTRHDPLGDYLSSLEKLRPIAADVVLPAHDHVFDDLTARLDEIEEHHRVRLEEMRSAIDADWLTPFQVAQRITWSVGAFQSIPEHHKVLAVGESLAHLHFLGRRGEVAQKDKGGLLLFRSKFN